MAEALDKFTILKLKSERLTDPNKLAQVRAELENLDAPQNLGPFEDLLYHVNSVLWDVEDRLRVLEAEDNFESEFTLLARSVYFANDLRAQIKNRISKILGEKLKEVKSYVN
jgi:hypothetical protein